MEGSGSIYDIIARFNEQEGGTGLLEVDTRPALVVDGWHGIGWHNGAIPR